MSSAIGNGAPPAPARADLAKNLERAMDLAPELAMATDGLNELIGVAEKAFRDLKLGVPATVPLTEHHTLGFRKVGDIFRLVINDEQPLQGVSREVRLRAVDHLPELLAELVRVAEGEVARVNAARASLQKFLKGAT